MNPFISIVVPAYNAQDTISRCINSILKQSFPNFELLIINDGSSDSTESICSNYLSTDARISLFNQTNAGVSTARNKGIKEAKGDWIAFCDADDWVDDLWLEQFLNTIDAKTDLAVQGFKCTNWPTGENKIGVEDYKGDKQAFLNMLHADSVIGYLWCKLFKRSIIEEQHIYFNPEVAILEDEEFVLNYLTKVRTVANAKEGYYNYTYPNYHEKYHAKHKIDVATSMTSSVREIYKEDYLNSPLAARYYFMALALLSIIYKNGDPKRKGYLRDFLNFYKQEIQSIKIQRELFKPMKHLLFVKHANLSHQLFTCYIGLIKLLNK